MMFDRWLAGKASTDQSSDPFEIDFEWLRQYEPVQEALTKLNGLIRNKNCQAEIINTLKKAGKLHAGDFDFTKSDRSEWEAYYVTHADLSHNKVKIVTGTSVYDADQYIGLAACLGDFDIRVLPKGAISPNADGGLKITINGFSVYVRDSFDFEDWLQPLGYWSYKEKKFVKSLGQLILEKDKTFLWNSSFRAFRKYFNHGGNFLVYSNLMELPNFEPFDFSDKN